MAYFLLRLSPPRPSFPFDATETEKALFADHSDYWLGKADRGEAIAVGPVFDPAGTWGLALVEAEDDAAARSLADADPVIRADAGFAYTLAPVPSLILRQP